MTDELLDIVNDELLDIVNDEDIVIDRQMRSAVHQLGLQHRGAHVFLFTADGKLLIQKRSTDRAHSPSLLDCSVSEHVKAGESYLAAAQRGLKEEMGVEGIEIKEIAKFRMNYGANDNEISVLYEGIVNPAQVEFDPIEIESIQYLSVGELEDLINKESEKFCGWFIELLNLRLHGSGKMEVMNL
ncbi:MAG: NUDIX domain-containing protein [Anaerolineales bacterium]|nr:NUDIX domain-containing protein [Anaerolineales bacterium]